MISEGVDLIGENRVSEIREKYDGLFFDNIGITKINQNKKEQE